MVSDLLGSRRFPSNVQLTFNANVECQLQYSNSNAAFSFASLTLGVGSPSAEHESSMSDPTRIVEFSGEVVITGGSETEKQDLIHFG